MQDLAYPAIPRPGPQFGYNPGYFLAVMYAKTLQNTSIPVPHSKIRCLPRLPFNHGDRLQFGQFIGHVPILQSPQLLGHKGGIP
jgi:hypothetical protein